MHVTVLCLLLTFRSHKGRYTHSMPCPCRAAQGLECVFPNWFTQYGRVWFTLAMPRPCHALTTPFFSRPRHSTAVERRPVGYMPAFGCFRLSHTVPQTLLSEAYQSTTQRSIRTTVKSGSSTLQKRRSVNTVGLAVRIFPATMRTFTKDTALSEHGRGAAWHVWINGKTWQRTAWARRAMCELAFSVLLVLWEPVWLVGLWITFYVQGLSGKYPSILNISRPVAWPWCNLAASQWRPCCAYVKIHTPVGLVSRQWDAVDCSCVRSLPSHSQIPSLSTTILSLGKARSRREPNLGCKGADRPDWCDDLPKILHESALSWWSLSARSVIVNATVTQYTSSVDGISPPTD